MGYRQKLTLTNKRLIYSKKAGWFKADWVRVGEILLDDIEEAYTHTSGGLAQSSSAMLKMKNGTVRELNVHTGSVDALGMLVAADTATDMAVRTKTVCDKWVSAVNQQLRLKTENRTEVLEKRIRELEEKLKENKSV